MRIRTRGYAAAAGFAVLALVATACGGSSGGGSSSGTSCRVAGLRSSGGKPWYRDAGKGRHAEHAGPGRR